MLQLSVDYIADKTAAEERIRMYARFEVYSRISIDLVSETGLTLYVFSLIKSKLQ